jgi:hypothetical protein
MSYPYFTPSSLSATASVVTLHAIRFLQRPHIQAGTIFVSRYLSVV